MPAAFRIIDTGVREGRANIAFDAALIEERQAGRVPDTIRFLSFPPTALIGRHQDLSRERDLDSAAQRVVTLKELLGPNTPDLELIKLALIKGFKDVLGIEAEYGEITTGEEALARRYFDEEIGTEEFLREIDNPGADERVLAGTHTGAGGTIDTFVKLEGPTRSVLQRVLISGDFFVTPPRVVFDLESALQGTPLNEVGAVIAKFFETSEVDTLSVTPADFKASIANALEQGSAHG